MSEIALGKTVMTPGGLGTVEGYVRRRGKVLVLVTYVPKELQPMLQWGLNPVEIYAFPEHQVKVKEP